MNRFIKIILVCAMSIPRLFAEGCNDLSFNDAKKGISEDLEYLTCNALTKGFCWSLFGLLSPSKEQVDRVNFYITKLSAYEPLLRLNQQPIVTPEELLAVVTGLRSGIHGLVENLKKFENQTSNELPKTGEEEFENAIKDGLALMDSKFAEFDAAVAKQNSIKEAAEAYKTSINSALYIKFEGLEGWSYDGTSGYVYSSGKYVERKGSYDSKAPYIKQKGAVRISGQSQFIQMKQGKRLVAIRNELMDLAVQEKLNPEQIKLFVDAIVEAMTIVKARASEFDKQMQTETVRQFSWIDGGYVRPENLKLPETVTYDLESRLNKVTEITAAIEKMETMLSRIKSLQK